MLKDSAVVVVVVVAVVVVVVVVVVAVVVDQHASAWRQPCCATAVETMASSSLSPAHDVIT